MWRSFILVLIVCCASCTGNKQGSGDMVQKNNDCDSAGIVDIQGQWSIENIVVNDSMYLRPSEMEPAMSARIDFRDDNTFGIMTNCNHLGGNFTLKNDSIHFADVYSTEMACDNMEIEEMIKQVLPGVATIDHINDSITRLNTVKGDSYLVLRKATLSVK